MSIPAIKPENRVFVAMGDANERKFNSEILKRYGKDLMRTGNCHDNSHWAVKDYKSQTISAELKSRALKSTDFYDTMVGANKVDEYKLDIQQGKRCFFIFGFTDGLFEWEYTKSNMDELEALYISRGTTAIRTAPVGYVNKTNTYSTFNPKKPHLYIPSDKLTKFSDTPVYIPKAYRETLANKTYVPKTIFTPGVCLIKLD